MKKMKRLLVAMLSCLTAFACVAGFAACGDDSSSSSSSQTPASSSSSVVSSSTAESSKAEESSKVEESSKADESSKAEDSSSSATETCAHEWEFGNTEDVCQRCLKCGTLKGHIWGEWKVEVEATCTTEGSKTASCTTEGCTYVGTKTIEKAEHNYEVVEEAVAPDCTNTGLTAVEECTMCHDKKGGDVVEALGHKETTIKGTAATCTEDGKEDEVVCEVCGEHISGGEVIPTDGHDYEVQPTCGVNGVCKICGEVEDSAKAHNWTFVPEVFATCTTAGHSYYYECTNCKEKDREVTTTPASHLYGTYVGQKIDAPVYAELNYVDEKGQITVDGAHAASCTQGAVCYLCGETVTAPVAHRTTLVNNVFAVENCTEDGYYAYKKYNEETKSYDYYANYCDVCEQYVDAKVVKALGHDYEWTRVNKAATCTEDGELAHGKCNRCETVEATEVIAAKGHNYTKLATCTANAVCKDCGELKDTKLSHNYTGVIEAKAPTCTEIGWEAHNYCKDCGTIESYVELEALNHKIGDDSAISLVNTVAATCTDDGEQMHFVCSLCEQLWSAKKATATTNGAEQAADDNWYVCGSKISKVTVIKATGHKFDTSIKEGEHKYVAAKNAKCEESGNTVGGWCKNCERFIVPETIPALGHDGDRDANYKLDEDGNRVQEDGKDIFVKFISSSSKAATCTAEAYCGICNKKQSKWDDKEAVCYLTTQCELGEEIPVKSATCQEAGVKIAYQKCSCGQIYVDGSKVKEYVKDAQGNDTEKVKSYWKETDVVIAQKAHAYDVKVAKKDATCTEDGWNEYYICRFCGEVKGSIKTIKALGHCNANEGKTCQTSFFCDRIVSYEMDGEEYRLDDNGNKIPVYCNGQNDHGAEYPSEKPAKAHTYEQRWTGMYNDKNEKVYVTVCSVCGNKKED